MSFTKKEAAAPGNDHVRETFRGKNTANAGAVVFLVGWDGEPLTSPFPHFCIKMCNVVLGDLTPVSASRVKMSQELALCACL